MTVISVLTVIQTGCGRARLGTSQGAPDLGTARFAAAAAVMVGMHSYNNTVGFVPSGHIPPPPPTSVDDDERWSHHPRYNNNGGRVTQYSLIHSGARYRGMARHAHRVFLISARLGSGGVGAVCAARRAHRFPRSRLGTASSVAVQSARHGALTGFPDLGSARLRQ
jgi:hypothetical protein